MTDYEKAAGQSLAIANEGLNWGDGGGDFYIVAATTAVAEAVLALRQTIIDLFGKRDKYAENILRNHNLN